MPNADYEAKYGKGPHIAVDALVWYDQRVLIIKRKKSGLWAMPGGFVEPGEKLIEAAIREAREETNIRLYKEDLMSTYVLDDPNRDPRSHIISVVHQFFIWHANKVADMKAGDDAIGFRWIQSKDIKELEFFADHGTFLRDRIFRIGA